eukprot:g43500.t1
MIDAKSGPLMYKVWEGEADLNKHMNHMKAAPSQTQQEQNIVGLSEHLARLSEPVGSRPSPNAEETSKDKMDMANVAASMPLLSEEKDEFWPRRSGCKGGLSPVHATSIWDRVGGTGPGAKMPLEKLQRKEWAYISGFRGR